MTKFSEGAASAWGEAMAPAEDIDRPIEVRPCPSGGDCTLKCEPHQICSPVKSSPMTREEVTQLAVDMDAAEAADAINPSHYREHPSGVECIQITEHMNFTLGNAVKYIWRAALKGNQVEDLRKARWYLDRELTRLGA